MKIEQMALKDLERFEGNSRLHSAAQVAEIAASITGASELAEEV